MKKFSAIVIVLSTFTYTFSQNSLILNPNFENTVWPASAWLSQTNTGASIVVDEDQPIFISAGIHARTGTRFAYIGGGQNAKGRYEATLAQTFDVPSAGTGHLTFFYRYVRSSVDPGSYIRMKIDGNEVWSIAPHYIVDADEGYVEVQIQMGYISSGTHTFELEGYEFPSGGDLPMQFTFDDISFQTTSTASIEQTQGNDLSVVINGNMIQLNMIKPINEDGLVEITDLSGKVVLANRTYLTDRVNIEKPAINSGIYIISVKTGMQSFAKKIFFN